MSNIPITHTPHQLATPTEQIRYDEIGLIEKPNRKKSNISMRQSNVHRSDEYRVCVRKGNKYRRPTCDKTDDRRTDTTNLVTNRPDLCLFGIRTSSDMKKSGKRLKSTPRLLEAIVKAFAVGIPRINQRVLV